MHMRMFYVRMHVPELPRLAVLLAVPEGSLVRHLEHHGGVQVVGVQRRVKVPCGAELPLMERGLNRLLSGAVVVVDEDSLADAVAELLEVLDPVAAADSLVEAEAPAELFARGAVELWHDAGGATDCVLVAGGHVQLQPGARGAGWPGWGGNVVVRSGVVVHVVVAAALGGCWALGWWRCGWS